MDFLFLPYVGFCPSVLWNRHFFVFMRILLLLSLLLLLPSLLLRGIMTDGISFIVRHHLWSDWSSSHVWSTFLLPPSSFFFPPSLFSSRCLPLSTNKWCGEEKEKRNEYKMKRESGERMGAEKRGWFSFLIHSLQLASRSSASIDSSYSEFDSFFIPLFNWILSSRFFLRSSPFVPWKTPFLELLL